MDTAAAAVPDRGDRRVQRTRRTLRDALIALMLERGWDGVTVQDLCDRADVGRSTFYTHFADKEELLVEGFADLRRALRAGLAHAPAPRGPFRFARGLIEHAEENARLFRALVGKRSGQVVLRRFRDLVVALVDDDLAELGTPPAHKDATVRFLAGAFFELLSWWLEARTGLRAEDVERLFVDLGRGALAAATPPPRSA